MTITTETAMHEIKAELSGAFPDTDFMIGTFSIPGVGRRISINWTLGPSEQAVRAVIDDMRKDISIFFSRFGPCEVCGQVGHCPTDSAVCVDCDPVFKARMAAINERRAKNKNRKVTDWEF